MNPFNAVKKFHEKYNCDIDENLCVRKLDLRLALLNEELCEVEEELYCIDEEGFGLFDLNKIDKSKLTKELADLLYVTIGMAVTFGLPLEQVFKRVHQSNMTKTLDNKRKDGKVLKGDDYKPPYLDDLFDKDFYEVMPSECNHD